MHKELQAVFDEHRTPKHADRRAVHVALAPLLETVDRARQQLLEYKRLLHQAELAPHDTRLDGKLEAMHQTIGNGELQLDAMTRAVRDLARDFTQLDRYMEEWQADIARVEATAL